VIFANIAKIVISQPTFCRHESWSMLLSPFLAGAVSYFAAHFPCICGAICMLAAQRFLTAGFFELFHWATFNLAASRVRFFLEQPVSTRRKTNSQVWLQML